MDELLLDIKRFNTGNVLYQAINALENAVAPVGRLADPRDAKHPLGNNIDIFNGRVGSKKAPRPLGGTHHGDRNRHSDSRDVYDPLGKQVSTDFSVSTFLSNINQAGGLARQNRYEVMIPTDKLKQASNDIYQKGLKYEFQDDVNDWMTDYYQYDLKQQQVRLMAFCEQAQLPGYQFQMETARTYGPFYKIPHLPQYDDITLTFLCGADMLERYFFDAWMYLVMDPKTNNFAYIKEFAVDLDIMQYQEVDDENSSGASHTNYWTTLIDAYPVAVNAQDLGFENSNTYQKVAVTFTYKRAQPYDSSGAAPESRGTQESFRNTINFK